MNHDPICLEPLSLEQQEIVSATIEPVYCDICIAIAKARADEREKAARRVSEVFWPTDGSWVSEETTFDSMGRAAVAAVRGES